MLNFCVLCSNPRVPCKSGVIPTIDLTKWADYGVAAEYAPQQYVIFIRLSIISFLVNGLKLGIDSSLFFFVLEHSE